MSEYIDLNTVLSEFNEKGTLLKWLKKLEGESSGIDERLTTAEAAITEHAATLAQHSLSIGSHAGLISALTTVQTQLKGRVDTMEPKLETAEEDIDSLQTVVGDHTDILVSIQTEMQSLDARLESAEDSLSLLSQAIAKRTPYYVRVVVSGSTAMFSDYTYEELCTAIANGSNIVLYDGVTALAKDNLYYLSYNKSNTSFEFSNKHYLSSDGDKIRLRVLRISSNTINVVTKTIA